MKISLLSRTNQHTKWGGDLKALTSLRAGLESLGAQAEIVASCYDIGTTDFVFLTNTCLDLRNDQKILELRGLSYGVIPFYEDATQFFSPSIGFFEYLRRCLYNETEDGITFSLEALEENPHLINYYGLPPRKSNIVNYDILKRARVCIANTPTEAKTIRRDCPTSNVKQVFLPPGFAEDFSPTSSEEFLSLTGLKSKEYILQVGRLEFKKNQLGSIVASKDLDIPLVFIATKGGYDWYENACIDAILKWRKAPTIIIAESLSPKREKGLQIIPMPGGKKLSSSMLQSAFFHAGLHLHPAFQELPGYTYFESTVLGIPTIGSSWATIKEYFIPPLEDDRIEYCLPFDLPEIKRLILQKFGQTFSAIPEHPTFQRTGEDMAKEILSLLEG